MKSKNIVIGALAGLAVGTLVGALCNSKTMGDIASKAGERGKTYSKALKQVLSKFMEEVKVNIGIAEDEASDLIAKGKHESARIKEKIESGWNQS